MKDPVNGGGGRSRTGPTASIIVPAHNEQATIGRLLDGLVPLAQQCQIVVVANGCTDDTVRLVSARPWCELIEIETASKAAALNAGDAAARTHPRVYLDADVAIDATAMSELVALLSTDQPLLASPAVVIDESGASVLARAYQRVWALTDYRRQAHTGSGVYGLSRAARARFGEFPDIIADDLYVRLHFAGEERQVSSGTFTVFAARTIRAQIRRLGRTMAGELQLSDAYPELRPPNTSTGARLRLLRRVAVRPLLLPAFTVYAVAYALGRSRARTKRARGLVAIWDRDETTR